MDNKNKKCWCCGVNESNDVKTGLCNECQADNDKQQAESDKELAYSDNYAEQIFEDLQNEVQYLREQLWSTQEDMSFYQS